MPFPLMRYHHWLALMLFCGCIQTWELKHLSRSLRKHSNLQKGPETSISIGNFAGTIAIETPFHVTTSVSNFSSGELSWQIFYCQVDKLDRQIREKSIPFPVCSMVLKRLVWAPLSFEWHFFRTNSAYTLDTWLRNARILVSSENSRPTLYTFYPELC